MKANSEEVWKSIEGYEKLYEISSFGRVRSCKYNKTKVLKQLIINSGYSTISLCKKSISKRFLVHRIVAKHFIENTKNKKCVNHKDENKTNNNIENLEWSTYSENLVYGSRLEKVAAKKKKPVLQIKNNEIVKRWCSAAYTTTQGFHRGHVSECCNGVLKTHKGFIWKKEEDVMI